MARAASNVVDGDLAGTLAYGNAVVSGSNDAVDHFNIVGITDVAAVGVRAFAGSCDVHFVHGNAAGVGDVVMEVLAVQGCDLLYKCILNLDEFHVLHP